MHRFSKVAFLCIMLAFAHGCSKKDSGDGSATTEKASAATWDKALVEAFPNASLAWLIAPDGKVRVDVRDSAGTALTKTASGTVEWQEDGNKKSAKLAYDDGAKALVAAGPALKQDITELKYTLTIPNDSLVGTLHVPVGGTQALVEDAKTAASAPANDAPGPNGGVVQVVGDDRVEIVSDDDSDEVRVYLLDPSGKSVAVGDRTVTLAVNADSPDVIVLVPAADGAYLTGRWRVKTDPTRLTIVVKKAGKPHVAVVGWRPGVKLVVIGGPKFKVKTKGKGKNKIDAKLSGGPSLKIDLRDDDKDDGHGRGKGRGKGKGK